MTRERLAWLLGLLVLALGGWWLQAHTEWVEQDSRRAATGEARNNPVYAAEHVLRRLGMQAEHKEALTVLPPERARLVLLSSDWELVPERAEQLHQWVLRGGHLVLMQREDWDSTSLVSWVPIEAVFVKAAEKPDAAKRGPVPASALPDRTPLMSAPPLWGDTERVVGCHGFAPSWLLRVRPGHAADWTLTRVEGTPATRAVQAQQDEALRALQATPAKPAPPARPAPQAMRVAIGQGSVTVLNAENHLLFNNQVLRCDNPLLLAAAVQAEPGATAWIYLHEKREALLPWLWHQGWIAILAGALALAAALWRAAVRFGPRLAPEPRLRRSISEQVKGLGAYLQAGGRDALLAAQQRALTEAATRTLPRFARLSMGERVRAIAAVTGLAVDELSTAMSARFCTRAELPQRLQLLESARRRLHRPSERTAEERHPPS